MYRKFDIIIFKKIHYNEFIPGMNDPKKFGEKIIQRRKIDWLYKPRPAIILKSFKKKNNDSEQTRYLLLPMTSKNSIDWWYEGTEYLRIELKIDELRYGTSYLMLDSIMTIRECDIDDLYRNKDGIVRLTKGKQRWLRKQLSKKGKKLLNSMKRK